MKIDANVVSWILLVIVLSARISKQEKPEDCVPGKEFWSTYINSKGMCAPCPRYLDNCDEQGPDKEACEDSCGAKQISSPVPSSSTPTTSLASRSQLTKLAISTPFITVVTFSTALRPGKPTGYKKIHDDDETPLWVIIVAALFGTAALAVFSFVAVLLSVRKCRKNNMQRNVEDGFGPFPLRRPVQVCPSVLNIGGIQDTEGKQDSSLHLDETNS